MGRVHSTAEAFVVAFQVPFWVLLLSTAITALVVAAAFIFIRPRGRRDDDA
jgi:hypothetical protein